MDISRIFNRLYNFSTQIGFQGPSLLTAPGNRVRNAEFQAPRHPTDEMSVLLCSIMWCLKFEKVFPAVPAIGSPGWCNCIKTSYKVVNLQWLNTDWTWVLDVNCELKIVQPRTQISHEDPECLVSLCCYRKGPPYQLPRVFMKNVYTGARLCIYIHTSVGRQHQSALFKESCDHKQVSQIHNLYHLKREQMLYR